jgi:hypothetical protein
LPPPPVPPPVEIVAKDTGCEGQKRFGEGEGEGVDVAVVFEVNVNVVSTFGVDPDIRALLLFL